MFLKSWVNFSRPRASFISLARASLPLFVSVSLLLLVCRLWWTPAAPPIVQLFAYRFNYCPRPFPLLALSICLSAPDPSPPHLCHLSTRLLIYLYSRPRLIFSLTLWQVAAPPLPPPPPVPPPPLAVPLLLLLALLPSLLLVSPLRTHLSSRFVSLYFKLLFLFPFSLFPLLFLCWCPVFIENSWEEAY